MYTYGPVPSRRLGRSLGVSLIPPKTCSYNCVYCQPGKTTRLQSGRKSFYPKEDILAEIIKRGKDTNPDYITFAGDGEPTLCSDLGWLIDETKSGLGMPVAVITNGSLLSREDVRHELERAEVVIPTLDAGEEEIFRSINRSHRSITFGAMVQGLVDFRSEYKGELWIEVMLVKGFNDTEGSLASIRRVIDGIQPDRVYILTPIRPPAECWVDLPDGETIVKAQEMLGGATSIAELESGEFGIGGFSDARQAILEIGSRHPLRLSQAVRIQDGYGEPKSITIMVADGELIEVRYGGEVYLLPGFFVRGE